MISQAYEKLAQKPFEAFRNNDAIFAQNHKLAQCDGTIDIYVDETPTLAYTKIQYPLKAHKKI